MERMKLIGIGADGAASLPTLYKQWIDESERLVGGERQLSFFLITKEKKSLFGTIYHRSFPR